MTDLLTKINTLENKATLIAAAFEKLREENMRLNAEVGELQEVLERAKKDVESWKEQYEALKLASTVLGDKEDKTRAKLKINSLIRELDYCIDQLSE